MHKDAVVVFAVSARPSDDKFARIAHSGDLRSLIWTVAFVRGFQLHRCSILAAIGIELLDKDAVVAFGVEALPREDIFASAAHSGDLGVTIRTVGLVQRLNLACTTGRCAIGVESLNKDAVVVFAVHTAPSHHKFTCIAHAGDLW